MDPLVLETTLKPGYFFLKISLRRLPFWARMFIYLTPILLYKREFLLSCILSKTEFGKNIGIRLTPNRMYVIFGLTKVQQNIIVGIRNKAVQSRLGIILYIAAILLIFLSSFGSGEVNA